MTGSPRRLPRRPLLAALLLLASSCDIVDPDPVRVRVRNATGVTLEDLTLGLPTTVRYGRLEPGETSRYRSVRRAYDYISLRVVAGGTSIAHIPRDHLGRKRIEPGSYTYELTRSSSERFDLSSRLVRD